MLRTFIGKKKRKKKRKKYLGAIGFEPRTPAWESNVRTTAPEHYVFLNESSFYIITYSSYSVCEVF